jgi:D-3-phosphoglycerate dehydrogenase
MLRILVTDTIHIDEASLPGIEVSYSPDIEVEELKLLLPGFDAIVTRSRTQVDEALIAVAPRLKVIGRAGVGVDNIDVEAASRHGIIVLNAPEANNVSAAELTLALMLNASRGVSRSDRKIRNGEWDRSFLGHEIYGSCLGIVGLGRIGSLVSQRAQALGMTVIAYDPYVSQRRAREIGVELYDDLHAMLTRINILTVHTPLTKETEGIIGPAEFDRMPDGVVVVNAARGGIVQEEALVSALDQGKVFAAGLDVFVVEPLEAENPLLGRSDVILTSHLGANTIQAQERVGAEILERTAMALKGDLSQGLVNAPALAPDVTAALGSHLRLGEILGKTLAQLADGRVKRIEVEFSGDFPMDPDPVVVAVTKGLLETFLEEVPNYINAVSIANERDISLSVVTESGSRGYTNHILASVITDVANTTVGGTVLEGEPRIVSVDDFPLEIRPEGTILVCQNYDRPGAMGRIGTVLGDAGVNIKNMQLSRVDHDGSAMFALSLDQLPSEPVLEVLRNLSDVIQSLRVVRL